jgi:CheY-like chemotaxis protein
MNEALDDLSSELDSLLDISKLDAGVIAVTRKTVSLGLLLQNTYEAFLPDARAKQLRFKIYCPDEVCTDTDKVLLERVVRNLVQNAIKYTLSGSVILKVETGKDFHSLVIEDTGPGIPESEHFRIFEEFYQIDNPERDRARGLGLGLAIVKRLIDLLGIEIALTSLLGVGTRFTLKLPISNSGDEIVDSRSLETSPAFGGLHVLVVDDETKIRLGMRELLEGMGCRVSDVDNSAAALRCATANSIDFVLADFRLRESDNGIATIQAIRKTVPLVPALLISGDTAPERLREATEAGIPLLHKPVSLSLLKSEIAKGLRKDTENYDDKSK